METTSTPKGRPTKSAIERIASTADSAVERIASTVDRILNLAARKLRAAKKGKKKRKRDVEGRHGDGI